MKLAIFGTTGGTGRCLVEEALSRGHEVAALARDPGRLQIRDGRLKVFQGDVLDPSTLDAPIAGADAVVSALGIGYHRSATTVYSAGTGNIMAAMAAAGVSRLSCISASSIELPPKTFVRQWLFFRFVLQPMLRRPYADIARMEEMVRSSDVDWTIMRPARLTNGRRRGAYRTGVVKAGEAAGAARAASGKLPRAWSISRADLAHYMIG